LLALDTATHTPDTVCIPFRVQGRICVPRADDLANQPSHKAKRGIRRCIRRLRGICPSLLRWMFHGCPVSLEVQRVPKLCGRYVHLQLFGLFENQGQSAKKFHHINLRKPQILGFLRKFLGQSILVCQRIIDWFV
jgi:hypothetical protein